METDLDALKIVIDQVGQLDMSLRVLRQVCRELLSTPIVLHTFLHPLSSHFMCLGPF